MVGGERLADVEPYEAELIGREDAVDTHPRAPLVRGECVAESPAGFGEAVLVLRQVPVQNWAEARQVGVAGDDDRLRLLGRGFGERAHLQSAEPHVLLDVRGRGAAEKAPR